MHDPRTSTALRTIVDLTAGPPPSRWRWSIARLDDAGRVSLGPRAVDVIGSRPLRLRWHRLALLLDPPKDEEELTVLPDRRGRLLVPTWLRERGPHLLIGVDHEGPRILVAPAEVLDRFGDVLVGDR
jgi:hypothetical protein